MDTFRYEKTCGSILFMREKGIKKYLLVKNADSGHIGFPKGHMEKGETESETAEREVFEETGVRIKADVRTRQVYIYKTSDSTIKECVYFCSEFSGSCKDIKIQEEEISESWLVDFERATELLNYPQDIEILKRADDLYD
ncbi:MAG: bis(5'-nucleosyl)-tetraphosphatase [Porcipelethomonas sp.]